MIQLIPRLIQLINLINPLTISRRRLSRSIRLVLSVLLGVGLVLLCLVTRVSAAETVSLQYGNTQLAVPLKELQAFVEGDEFSPELQTFLENTEVDPQDIDRWLTTTISPPSGTQIPQGFVLLQINKILGDPLEREDLQPLRKALSEASSSDSAFSVMEVLQQYPKTNVRLSLDRLGQVYTDTALFVTRIEPVLNVAKQLLPELVCDCAVTAKNPNSVLPSTTIAQTQDSLKSWFAATDQSSTGSSTVNPAGNSAATFSSKSAGLLLSSTTSDASSSYANKQLVFAFGPVRPAISIADLTKFAETGELSRGWRFYLNVANVNREELRAALVKPIQVSLQSLDEKLNSLLGEFLLYEVGQIIQTPSGLANIQALRSAAILSVADNNQLTMLELLQHYPTAQIQVNGIRLARFGKTASRLANREGIASAALDLEGWLLQVQASAAENVCACEDEPSDVQVISAPIPEISADNVAKFLPANWQPVASHREDRGIIKVVWLQGTPYDMGYQHGTLLHDEIASIGPKVIRTAQFAAKGFALGRLATKRTYPDVIEECRGLVDATQDIGITMDVCALMAYADVFQEILGYTLPNELFWEGCNQFVATNGATIDGRLYHGSSVDNNKKPVPYVINNPVVFVRQPTNALPHVFVAYPGVVWPNSGMNVAGISLGLDTAHPNSPNELLLQGRSNVQIMAKILQTSTSFAEARSVMEMQPRVRANLIMITDGKSKEAGVFEFTGKSLGVRSLQEDGVLYVTNHFVLPEMYEKQPLPLNQSSVSRFVRFSQLMEPDQPDSHYGQIDPQIMATILRDRVNPYTHQASPLNVFDDDASPGGNGSLRQAIYDPEGLRLWVAAGPPPVPENPFVCFSLGEMLGFPDATPCQEAEM